MYDLMDIDTVSQMDTWLDSWQVLEQKIIR